MAPIRFPYPNVTYTYDAPAAFGALFATDLGQAIWDFLRRPDVVRSLIVAARLGQAPVSAISDELLAEFGSANAALPPKDQLAEGLRRRFPAGRPVTADRLKQFIGSLVKAVLATHGFVIRSKNAAARDPEGLFSTSARYEAG